MVNRVTRAIHDPCLDRRILQLVVADASGRLHLQEAQPPVAPDENVHPDQNATMLERRLEQDYIADAGKRHLGLAQSDSEVILVLDQAPTRKERARGVADHMTGVEARLQ